VTWLSGLARELEPVAARGWPAAECDEIGGWRLHAASGFSGRINACWPLDDPGLPLEEAAHRTERWYSARGLPTRFKIVEGSALPLLSHLTARGYQPSAPTSVMVGDTTGMIDPRVKIEVTLDADFLKVFAASQEAADGDAKERLEALERVGPPRFFAVAGEGAPAAVGACAVERPWVGIFAMRTHPDHRRRGLGRRVLSTLLAHAEHSGAGWAYLQVEAANFGAIDLYRRAGFSEAYRYRYWVRGA
jgi:ribosomal protein S18 acetylase RimI-like enzyme